MRLKICGFGGFVLEVNLRRNWGKRKTNAEEIKQMSTCHKIINTSLLNLEIEKLT